MDINARILFLMEREKVNGYDLAKKTGLSPSTISTLFRKNRQPNLTTLQAICTGLGISMAEFFNEESYKSELEKKYHSLSKKSRDIIKYLIENLD